jgi:hypothetical protein
VLPQSMPAGLLATTPDPVPWRETVSGWVWGGAAVTDTRVAHGTLSAPLVTWTVGE